jgi:AraC-like DNA-binding protein
MTFIVAIGPEIDVVAQTDSRQRPESYRCVLSGLQASPALISHNGHQEGIAIELTPLGSRSLFGLPARELWDRSYEFADVVGRAGSELWERLQEPQSWDRRFGVCDKLLSQLQTEFEVAPELSRGWADLVSSGGRISIEELASQTGYSRQHLTRRFRDEFGLTPKLAARVMRFERARRMIQSVPSFVTMAQVAASTGYYDQAHMNRDFTELAGCSPSELLTEEVPFFQEESGQDQS